MNSSSNNKSTLDKLYSSKSTILVTFSIFLVISILFPPTHGLWVDETSSYFFASLPWQAYIEHISSAEANMSLYYSILKIYIAVMPESDLLIRLLSAGFGLTGLIVIHYYCKTLFTPSISFWAPVLASFNPFLFQYFWEARSYSMVFMFGSVNLILFWHAFQNNTRSSWIIFAIFTGISLYSHIFLTLLTATQFGFAITALTIMRRLSTYALNLFLAIALSGIISIPLLAFFLSQGSDASNIEWIKPISAVDTWHFYEHIFTTKFEHSLPPRLTSSALILFSLLAFIWVILRRRNTNLSSNNSHLINIYLAVCSVLPTAMLFLAQHIQPIFVERYLIFIVPSYIILILLLAKSIKSKSAFYLVISLITTTQLFCLWQSNTRDKFDFINLYADLERRCEKNSLLLFTNESVSTTYFYYQHKFPKLAKCFPAINSANLNHQNFYHKMTIDELPALSKDEHAWIVFGHAGKKSRSIYQLLDENALNKNNYLKSYHKKYPINLHLIRIEGIQK